MRHQLQNSTRYLEILEEAVSSTVIAPKVIVRTQNPSTICLSKECKCIIQIAFDGKVDFHTELLEHVREQHLKVLWHSPFHLAHLRFSTFEPLQLALFTLDRSINENAYLNI